MKNTVRYSFVLPVYNEEEALPLLLPRLEGVLGRLDGPAEAIFVDDGSQDRSLEILEAWAQKAPWVRVVQLSRNFGHQLALTAGIARASGEAIVLLDADLQDPPELSLEMIARWQEGHDVVYAVRTRRSGETWLKRASAKAFYALLRRFSNTPIHADAGDFRLISRRVAETYLRMPEQARYLRGMFDWMGFSQAPVYFARPPRAAGQTKYTWHKMLGLALSATLNFSDAPLRAIVWLGFFIACGAFGGALWVALDWLNHSGQYIKGWPSVMVALGILMGINIMLLGVVGLYVGRIHEQAKGRPLFLIARERGFGESPHPARPAAHAPEPASLHPGAAPGAQAPQPASRRRTARTPASGRRAKSIP